jgi:putative transposase
MRSRSGEVRTGVRASKANSSIRHRGWAPRRFARLMREWELQELSPRKFRVITDSNHGEAIVPNALARDFVARRPNEKWATDITDICTAEEWSYLAVAKDLYSRRIVGWLTANHMEPSRCLDASMR